MLQKSKVSVGLGLGIGLGSVVRVCASVRSFMRNPSAHIFQGASVRHLYVDYH